MDRVASLLVGITVATLLACGGGPGRDVDGGADATSAAPIDGGIDGSPPADAPAPSCDPAVLEATCDYRGYGTTCDVPCSFPADCSFSVSITWREPYCCPAGIEPFRDCRCIDGYALCMPGFAGTTPRMTPFTTCEFCEPDGGLDGGGAGD